MTKIEFLSALRENLYGLPKEDIEQSLDYYSEIIEDRIEDGLTEEAAVDALGTAEEVAEQILMDASLPKIIKTKVKPSRPLKIWEVILLILGSPIWLTLLLTVAIVIFAIYIVIWAIIISLYSAVLSFAIGAISGIFGFAIFIFTGNPAQGTFFLGAGLICAGLAVLSFLGCNKITKGVITLSKKFLLFVKSCFIRKGETK